MKLHTTILLLLLILPAGLFVYTQSSLATLICFLAPLFWSAAAFIERLRVEHPTTEKIRILQADMEKLKQDLAHKMLGRLGR